MTSGTPCPLASGAKVLTIQATTAATMMMPGPQGLGAMKAVGS